MSARVEVKIETDGSGPGTVISINGVPLDDLAEFNLSVRAQGNVKVQGRRYNEKYGVWEPFSYFGGDFEKLTMKRVEKPTKDRMIGGQVGGNGVSSRIGVDEYED